MPLVKLKQKGQMTLPAEIRQKLDLNQGDMLEAKLQRGRIVLSPKVVVDREREAAFERMDAMAKRARTRWEAEGKTEEEMQRLIDETVQEVRAERYAREQAQK